MEVSAVIDSLGKIATKEQLVAAGLSGFDLTAAVRKGEIRRIRRAYYATPGAGIEAVTAVRVGGRLAGTNAARSYGLWAGFDDRTHVAMARNASRLRTNLAPSRSNLLTPDTSEIPVVLHWIDTERSAQCWRVSAPDALRQVARWSDTETAIACLDTARTALGLTSAFLRGVFANSPISERMLVSRSFPGSDAGTESIVRQRLERIGVRVDQQVSIASVGRVDMVVRGTRIVIEVDGRAFHGTATAFENDRRRDAMLASRGFTVIRLSFAQIFGQWPACERAILQAITQFRNV